MPSIHLLNVYVHVAAGSIGIVVGLVLLARDKGTAWHRAAGRAFAALASVVCVTAWLGTAFFRFIPIFAVLSLLVPYCLFSGWHVIYTRERGPNWVDALLIGLAFAGSVVLVPVLLAAPYESGSNPIVAMATLGALGAVVVYDAARWLLPVRWHAQSWRYEHIYKIVSTLSGMASAAAGNAFQNLWAQLMPSVAGMLVIGVCMWREYRRGAPHRLATA